MDKHWHYGFNMPGYLPDSDPIATDNWEVAYDSLKYDLELDLDWLQATGNIDDPHDAMVQVDRTAEFNADYYFEYGKFVYWIQKCSRKDCMTLEKELDTWLQET